MDNAVQPAHAVERCIADRAVQLAGANWVAPFFHLIPVLGSVLAILILGERIQFYHALGFALVMSGIAIASRRKVSDAAA